MLQYVANNINRSYYTRLAGFAAQLEKQYKKGVIHDFRLDIKKLRAFYRLISLESVDAKPLKLPHKLKVMYRGLGKVRDLQQQQKSVEAFAQKKGIRPQYLIDQLMHQLKKRKSKKSFLLPQKYFPKHAKEIGEELPPQLSADTLRTFFMQKKQATQDIINRKLFTDDELHSIRKNIKDMMYVSDIYTNDIDSALPRLLWAPEEQKRMEALAKDLGDHNDVRNSLAWLQRSTTGYKGKDKESIDAYYRAQVQEKKRLRNKITLDLHTFFSGIAERNEELEMKNEK